MLTQVQGALPAGGPRAPARALSAKFSQLGWLPVVVSNSSRLATSASYGYHDGLQASIDGCICLHRPALLLGVLGVLSP